MKEYYYDKLLNIKTGGEQKDFNKSLHYHRYEPTPYVGLETLFKHYSLKSTDHLVDFGCGKGRLNFYVHHTFKSSVVGVEMNRLFYEEALENRDNYIKRHKSGRERIQFVNCLAEEYTITPQDNHFYFFNPFSVQVFMKVINNIQLSVEASWREVEVILYYPSEDYIYYLENQTSFQLWQEVKLELYNSNPNERLLIYRL